MTQVTAEGLALEEARAQLQEQTVAVNQALMLSSVRQHELRETADKLNIQLNVEIAERTEAQSALRESSERYRTLFDLAPSAVYSCDATGAIRDHNARAAELWGREPKVGDPADRFCGSFRMYLPDGTFLPHEQCPMADVLSGKTPEVHDGEVEMERLDGSRLTVVVNIRPLKNEQGKIIGAINCFVDITDRKRAESELGVAKIAAEKANVAKSVFLSGMSHELRTPLNAILGFTQLIESGSPAPTPSQQRSLDKVLKAGWYLLELINEILDLSLIESGKLVLSQEVVSLSELIDECREMVEPLAQRRGIAMTFSPYATPCFVKPDRTRIKQVLINLISNAVKYNKPGGKVSVEYSRPAPDLIRIGIRDTGAGLAPDQLAQLFQPFNRLGRESGPEVGTGIGLVVAKRLVDLMGGAIGATSVEGVGSLFWIELQVAAAPLPAVVEEEPPTASRALPRIGASMRTVLCVEDDP
ncbi:MAG: ATP-binding protein, partial [Vicinamibacteria bacterium]